MLRGLLFLLILMGLSPLAAAPKDAETIAGMASGYLFELNRDGLERMLNPYLQEKNQIRALTIVDSADQTLFWSYPPTPPLPLPLRCAPHESRSSSLIQFEGVTIGEVVLCTQLSADQVVLTAEELAWLRANPTLRVHNEQGWQPFNFNRNGIPMGLSIDLMTLLANKIGVKVEYVTGEWSELLNMAMNKKLDVMLNIAKTPQREQLLLYVGQYSDNPNAIFGRSDDPSVVSIESLNGKRVAVVDGFFQETVLRERFPLIHRVIVGNISEAIKAVVYGKADAVIDSRVVMNYTIQEMMIDNIEIKADFDTPTESGTGLNIAVRNDAPLLQTILAKALTAVTPTEMNAIRKKWIVYKSNKNSLKLSSEQQHWIKEHSVVRVGGERDWAPFDFVNEQGESVGLANNYLQLIGEMTGLRFQVEVGASWEGLLEQLRRGEIDLLPALYYTPEREQFAHFSTPYLSLSDALFARTTAPPIRSVADLAGRPVAVVKGYAVADWLRQNHPTIERLESESILQGLQWVTEGRATAFINDSSSTNYLIDKNLISGIEMKALVQGRSPISLHMAAKEAMLAEIVTAAIKQISQEDRRAIHSQWISSSNLNDVALNLTDQERSWLMRKPELTFAVDPDWLPIERIATDSTGVRYEGMMADLLKRIEELTSIRFRLIATERWPQSVELAKKGQVEMLAAVSRTAERDGFLNFSDTTIELYDGVLMDNSAEFISSVADLAGLRVGVPEGTAVHELIVRDYPDLIVVPIKGTQPGVEALLAGDINAYIGNLEVIGHLLNQQGIYNLKVALKLEKKRLLHIALGKSVAPEALSIINKAIRTISAAEMATIRQRWIGLRVNEGINYLLLWKIGLGVLLVLLLIIYNNYRLNRLVRAKTADIELQKEALREFNRTLELRVVERTAELAESEERTRDALSLVTSSIQYASRIQRSILPDPELVRDLLPNSFITWRPRDVVGGDIYWVREAHQGVYVTLGDCTGHGVPGAFMTLIANGAFEYALERIEQGDPAQLIAAMHRNMQSILGQDSEGGDSDDGIELGVVFIPNRGGDLSFAGARFALFYLDADSSEVHEVKGDKKGIAYRGIPFEATFTNHVIAARSGRRLVMTTDGILDQIGGAPRRMMGKNQFKKLLLESRQYPIHEVGERIYRAMEIYRGEEVRRDDLSIVGFEL